MAHFFSAACVVHNECDVDRYGVFEFLEDFSKVLLLGVFVMGEAVENIDAAQGVLVSCVAVKKFMLHEIGQFSKLRDPSLKESVPMHAPEDVCDLPAVLQNLFKGFPV